MLVRWVSHLCEMARYRQCSLEIPHSSFTSSLSHLHMLRLVVHSQTLRTLHMKAYVYSNVAVIKLPVYPLTYNIEGLDTSHRCHSQFSLTMGSLCKCTISLCSYTGAYVNRWLIVYQQLHCAVFSDSYLLILLALYQAHWNY